METKTLDFDLLLYGETLPEDLQENVNVCDVDAARARPRGASCWDSTNLVVLSTFSLLPEISEFLQHANNRNHLKLLLIRSDMDARLFPQAMRRAGIRILRNVIVHSGEGVPQRVLLAWKHGVPGQMIAHAEAFNGSLLVVACNAQAFEISMDEVPALRSMTAEDRAAFVLDPDGSHLYWPASDVHLNLEALRYWSDPEFRRELDKERALADSRYGRVIAQLRQEAGLTQDDIPGLSRRQVSRIENGARPSTSALESLARAHGLETNDYLGRIAERLRDD